MKKPYSTQPVTQVTGGTNPSPGTVRPCFCWRKNVNSFSPFNFGGRAVQCPWCAGRCSRSHGTDNVLMYGYCCTEGVTSWWLQATLLPCWSETACLCLLRMCAVHCQCRDGLWWTNRSCAALLTQGLLAVSVFTILILKVVFRFSYNAFVFSSVFLLYLL